MKVPVPVNTVGNVKRFVYEVLAYVVPPWLGHSLSGRSRSRRVEERRKRRRRLYLPQDSQVAVNANANGGFESSMMSSPVQCSTPLEVIPEEEREYTHDRDMGVDSLSDRGGLYSDTTTPPPPLSHPPSHSHPSHPPPRRHDKTSSRCHNRANLSITETWWDRGVVWVFGKPLGVVSWVIRVVGWVVVLPMRAVGRMVRGGYQD
ncbi:hypothetical protein CVT24_001326 [Panaeolus cyanescens]|uniref:Uncharacterized protein n=1 Tax=Panaeolus cyanescens TaxID=181874 RepID=A0A409WS25_9AGAR|nr:hypothetical protein CVT24_001326 [Panaeolus cyanescens]